MNLDLSDSTVQIALIAAVATVVTAFISLINALVTALVTVFNHLFEARVKRLEKVRDIRTESAIALLRSCAEIHSEATQNSYSVGFAKLPFLLLLLDLEKLPSNEQGNRFKVFLEKAPEREKQNREAVEAAQIALGKLLYYFTPEVISSLFWFSKPLRLKNKLEKLVEECQGVCYSIVAELSFVSELEREASSSPDVTQQLRTQILEKMESKLLDEWRGKVFKTVTEVQKMLAPYVR